MTWSSWRLYFEHNARRPLPRAVTAPELPPHRHVALLRSLQKFQLGEAGEGRLAHEIDHARLGGNIDDDFRACVKLFVREEGRHGRLLALGVRALGGQVLARDWTNGGFTLARRVLGCRFKLLVALVAEVIGAGFYGVMAERLPAGDLNAMLEEIGRDEQAHLVFQSAFFRGQVSGRLGRVAFRGLWWAMGAAASALVLWDHRATFRAFDIPLSVPARRFTTLLAEVSRRVTHRDRKKGARARAMKAFVPLLFLLSLPVVPVLLVVAMAFVPLLDLRVVTEARS